MLLSQDRVRKPQEIRWSLCTSASLWRCGLKAKGDADGEEPRGTGLHVRLNPRESSEMKNS